MREDSEARSEAGYAVPEPEPLAAKQSITSPDAMSMVGRRRKGPKPDIVGGPSRRPSPDAMSMGASQRSLPGVQRLDKTSVAGSVLLSPQPQSANTLGNHRVRIFIVAASAKLEDEEARLMNWVPKSIHGRIRFQHKSPGCRIRDCAACGVNSSSDDVVYGCFVFAVTPMCKLLVLRVFGCL